jgi:hypothetical protein
LNATGLSRPVAHHVGVAASTQPAPTQPVYALDFKENPMGGLIYLVGLVVVVMFILSLLGLR